MKILWITNILFPAVCKELGIPEPVVGGWMYASAKALIEKNNTIELAVATVYRGTKAKKICINGITYYMLPLKGNNTKYHAKLEPLWDWVVSDFKPDIAHLHGTEYAHGLAFLNKCPDIKTVLSIQGLVSVIARYYYAGMSFIDILRNITFRDIVRNDNIFQQRAKFLRRGLIEKKIISKVNHVIGRTSWDRSHVLSLQPEVKYHFCNETLRSEFYKHTWSYKDCEKYSIFLSQAGYPLKALHQMIKALPFILKKFPQTKLYVAGCDISNSKTFKHYIKRTGYGKYIKSLIAQYKLKDTVFFTGELSEKQMCERYLKSNVFICPSSIENSPNSLAEAQLMGVPCIGSYVGGIPDMMDENRINMYRFEEVEMLADLVTKVFSDDFLNPIENHLSLERHDPSKNLRRTLEIYNDILK